MISDDASLYSVDYFLDNVRKTKNCSIKTLSSEKNKQIVVIKMCNPVFLKSIYAKSHHSRSLRLSKKGKMMISYIPSTTRPLINLFCCKFKLMDIYDKLSTHGIILEGNFDVNPLTKIPNSYVGKVFNETNVIQGVLPLATASYLVIDNHNIIKIMSGTDLVSYKSVGINVQCIRGERLISNGTTEDTNRFDKENGMIVIAVDVNQNILIVYHQAINKYNMTSLLQFFNVKDAIIICNTENSHIIWKENGVRKIDKSNFVGDADEIVSNVITFSS